MTDVLLHGGSILSNDGSGLERADILVLGGAIAAVSPPGTHVGKGLEQVDAHDCVIIPGFTNAHTHAHGGLSRGGVPDRVSLEGFLAYAPALIGHRSTEDLRLSATLSAVELARKGCTSCIDMASELPAPTVAGMLAVGQAYAEVGIRAVIAPMVADRTLYEAYPAMVATFPEGIRAQALSFKTPSASALLDVYREAQRAWPFDRRQVQLGVGPAIPLHCSDELLAGCAEIAREFDVPLQTHLLESKLQALAQGRGPESTVRRLHRLGCLTPKTSLAHGVWVDADDMALIAASGATLVHNPMSNLRLGSGVAPLRQLLAANVNVAIGTDGASSADGQSMFEAIRLAAYLSRIVSPEWTSWVSAEEAFDLGTVAASRALGLGGQLGQVQAGMLADLVLVGLAEPHYVPLRHPLRQMVFAENGTGVRRVLVGGRTVFAEGHVPGVDEANLRVAAQEATHRLDQACMPAAQFAETAYPALAAFCCGAQGERLAVERQLFRPVDRFAT